MNVSAIYKILDARYGDLNWWPGETPYEVIVGAVLTQNTAWSNVEKAIAGFGGTLTPVKRSLCAEVVRLEKVAEG